jgi:hypothetical protein
MTEPTGAAAARELIDRSRYMTIATADADGRPWASPVWFAHEGYTDFLWVSRPDAQHSLNIKARAAVALVVFDSNVAPGAAQAVYADAVAEEVGGNSLEHAIGGVCGEVAQNGAERLDSGRRHRRGTPSLVSSASDGVVRSRFQRAARPRTPMRLSYEHADPPPAAPRRLRERCHGCGRRRARRRFRLPRESRRLAAWHGQGAA